jgi:hypothetical protein
VLGLGQAADPTLDPPGFKLRRGREEEEKKTGNERGERQPDECPQRKKLVRA